jgi:hypothetical protein
MLCLCFSILASIARCSCTYIHTSTPTPTPTLQVQTYKHCTREMGRYGEGDTLLVETWLVMEFCNRGSVADGVMTGTFRRKGDIWEVCACVRACVQLVCLFVSVVVWACIQLVCFLVCVAVVDIVACALHISLGSCAHSVCALRSPVSMRVTMSVAGGLVHVRCNRQGDC